MGILIPDSELNGLGRHGIRHCPAGQRRVIGTTGKATPFCTLTERPAKKSLRRIAQGISVRVSGLPQRPYREGDHELGPVITTVRSANQCPPGTYPRYNMPGEVQCRRPLAYQVGSNGHLYAVDGLGNLHDLGKSWKKKLKKVGKAVAKPIKSIAKPIVKVTKLITRPIEKKIVHKIVPKSIRKAIVKAVSVAVPGVMLVSKTARKEVKKLVGMRTTRGGKKVPFAVVTAEAATDPACMMVTECDDGASVTYNACTGLTYEQVCAGRVAKPAVVPVAVVAPVAVTQPQPILPMPHEYSVVQSPVGPIQQIAPGVSVFTQPPAPEPAYSPPAQSSGGGGGGGSSWPSLAPQAIDETKPAEAGAEVVKVPTEASDLPGMAAKPKSKLPLILAGIAVVGIGYYLYSKNKGR